MQIKLSFPSKTFTKLQEKYSYGYSTIKKINEGRLLKQPNINYPLRKLNKDQLKAKKIKV